jgi:hypothetical protein
MNIGYSNKTQHILWKKGKREFIIYNVLYVIACNDLTHLLKWDAVGSILKQTKKKTSINNKNMHQIRR